MLNAGLKNILRLSGVSWVWDNLIFYQKVKITSFSRSALAASIGSLEIVTGVGEDWFSSLARGVEWVDFRPQRFARTYQL